LELTFNVTLVVWVSVPLEPVTVTVNGPDLMFDGTVMVKVAVADLPDDTEIEAGIDVVTPVGLTVADNETWPLNEFNDFTVIVEVPLEPDLIVSVAGEAEIEKSDTIGAETVTTTSTE
jgi:hypothetical protein